MITLLLLIRATSMYGVVLHAHPVRGESHNQRNTTGEVATLPWLFHERCSLPVSCLARSIVQSCRDLNRATVRDV